MDVKDNLKDLGLRIENLFSQIEREMDQEILDAKDRHTTDEIVEAHRWATVAKTHMQQGLMALTRAIERPTTF